MNNSILDNIYKPDVLSCLSDLSNDEVFTPPSIANAMLDLLPKEIWSNSDIKILDPAVKSGVFLREAAKRFIEGEKDIFPDLQERIDHIMHEQLYGIACTELTALVSRRSLYCSKYPNGPYSISSFNNADGNIRFKRINHSWSKGKCIFCSASEKEYGRHEDLENHAYEFIHSVNPKEIFNMKFDVIISNPPYQLSDGGSNASAMPLYNHFVEQAKKLNPRFITMIIPSRWFAGGRALNQFRTNMLNDQRISNLIDYQQSKDCFPGVDIAGGVCYFLWNRDYLGKCCVSNMINGNPYTEKRSLNEFPIFVRNNIGNDIVKKVKLSRNFCSINTEMSNYNPFLIRSYEFGNIEPFEGSLRMLSSKGFSYVSKDLVKKNDNLINKYKVICSKVTAEHAGEADKNGRYRILSSLQLLFPNEICTESYVMINNFDSLEEANKFIEYLKTKFIRFLILQAATSINLTQDTFMFAPLNDFYDGITSDSDLYKKYGLTEKEIEMIETLIKPLDPIGGDE